MVSVKRKKWKSLSPKRKKILLLGITLIAVFLVLELFIGAWYEKPGYGYPTKLFVPDDQRGFRYQAGMTTHFLGKLYKNVEIRINSQGLRDIEHAYEKTPDIVRIIGLGDSVVFGSGVAAEDTMFKQLEILLDNVEVINAGVNHYALDQYSSFFMQELYKYDPDIVIVGITLNDAKLTDVTTAYGELVGERNTRFESVRIVVSKYCDLCTFMYNSLEALMKPKREEQNELYFKRMYDTWEEYSVEFKHAKEQIENMHYFAKSKDIKLALVIFPYAEQFSANGGEELQLPQKNILNICKELDIPCLDLRSTLDRADYVDYYLFKDNVHLNEKGHRLVAVTLKDFIDKMLPQQD